LTASRDGTAQIWVRETKNSVVLSHKKEVLHAAFSKDGKWVITGSADENLARIWNAVPMEISGAKKAIGEVLVDLRGHTAPVQCVAFSPDMRCAITGSADNTAKVWDITKLADEGQQPLAKEVLTLGGHAQPVTAVTFSSDGRLALTGSRDGTAIVWEATNWDRKDLALNID
jgi:WD40 repeat protein